MALIAVHEDIQEEVYQQIISVVGLVGEPVSLVDRRHVVKC